MAVTLPPRWRTELAQAFTDNLTFKLIALLLAVAFWVWVQSEPVVEHRLKARIEYTWPDGLVDEAAPTAVTFSVSGPTGLVRIAARRELVLPIDLSQSELGTRTLDLNEISIRGLPRGVEVVQVQPPTATIALDKRITRTVKVKPLIAGSAAAGWQLKGHTVQPRTVELSGPESVLREMDEISTTAIDISGLDQDRSFDVRLNLRSRALRAQTATVVVAVDVEPELSTRELSGLAVRVNEPGWTVSPPRATVSFTGPSTAVNALSADQISLIILPGPSPATWSPDPQESAMQVRIEGEPAEVKVADVSPRQFTLEPAPP